MAETTTTNCMIKSDLCLLQDPKEKYLIHRQGPWIIIVGTNKAQDWFYPHNHYS